MYLWDQRSILFSTNPTRRYSVIPARDDFIFLSEILPNNFIFTACIRIPYFQTKLYQIYWPWTLPHHHGESPGKNLLKSQPRPAEPCLVSQCRSSSPWLWFTSSSQLLLLQSLHSWGLLQNFAISRLSEDRTRTSKSFIWLLRTETFQIWKSQITHKKLHLI